MLDLSSEGLTIDDPAKQALIEQIRKLTPKTYVGLLRAQESLQVLSDPSVDREAIATQIEQQTLSGKTGLLPTIDAIGGIADAMIKKSAVRLAILYVSDGDVKNYREDFANPVINSSDAHDLEHRTTALDAAWRHVEADFGKEAAVRLLEENPRAVLAGVGLNPAPYALKKKWFGLW